MKHRSTEECLRELRLKKWVQADPHCHLDSETVKEFRLETTSAMAQEMGRLIEACGECRAILLKYEEAQSRMELGRTRRFRRCAKRREDGNDGLR
ncbi:MAG: hypothetical protein V1821_03515 [bacterium]